MALALGACGEDDDREWDKAGDGSITVFSLWGGSEQEAFQRSSTSSRRTRESRPSTSQLVTSSR